MKEKKQEKVPERELEENEEQQKEEIEELEELEETEVEEKKDLQKDSLQELTDLLQRTQANFENYRKQTEKRMEEVKQMASKDMIMQVIPLFDNFELALKNFNQNQNSKDFAEGVELIYSQLLGILKNSGVEIILSEGKQFDSYYHEALLKEESGKPENEVLEEFQKGFTLCGRVIRHAKVKISAGKDSAGSKYNNKKEEDNEKDNVEKN